MSMAMQLVNGTTSITFASSDGPVYPPVLLVFLTLQVAGAHVLLPFLLVTFWFTSAKRHITLTNLFLCFVLTGIVMSLLLYSGEYRTGQPDAKWCMAQASLSYAVAPMDSTAVLCLLIHVWNSLRVAQGKEYNEVVKKMISVTAMLAPYLVGVAFGVAGVLEVLKNPSGAQLRPDIVFFCTVPPGTYTLSTSIATATPLVASTYFIASIALALCRSMMKRRREPLSSVKSMDVAFVARVVLYGGYVVVGLVLTIVSIFFPSVVPDMFCATIPIFIGLLFGSQKDVLQAWRKVLSRDVRMTGQDAWTQV